MTEQAMSLIEASKNLASISRSTEETAYLLTEHGKTQSVLISHVLYRQLSTLAEFADAPEELAELRSGLMEVESGRTISGAELLARLDEIAQGGTLVEAISTSKENTSEQAQSA